MKKHLIVLLVLALMLGLAACGGGESDPTTVPTTGVPTEPTTEPTTLPTTVPTTAPVDGAQVGGVDLTGMSPEQAKQALTEAAAAYKLSFKVNGKTLTLAAADLGVAVDDAALASYLEALASGGELPGAILTFDTAKLRTLLGDQLNTAPVNASVSYNSSKKQFVASEGKNGTSFDLDAAAEAASAAIGLLQPAAEAEVKTTAIAPDITASGEKMKTFR